MKNDFEFVTRHRVVWDDDFWFELDEFKRAGGDCFLLAHIRVHRWSPSVFKRMLREWKLLREHVTTPMFVLAEQDDDKWEGFVRAFGFEYLMNVKCNNGEDRRLFLHQVKDAHVRV